VVEAPSGSAFTTHSGPPRISVEAAKKVLFVCSQNRLRSPTAEQMFSGRRGLEVSSAGTINKLSRYLPLP
jgi:Low molecular weight phosphotyrosine protein phosphatase